MPAVTRKKPSHHLHLLLGKMETSHRHHYCFLPSQPTVLPFYCCLDLLLLFSPLPFNTSLFRFLLKDLDYISLSINPSTRASLSPSFSALASIPLHAHGYRHHDCPPRHVEDLVPRYHFGGSHSHSHPDSSHLRRVRRCRKQDSLVR